jgi:hypothetical protein
MGLVVGIVLVENKPPRLIDKDLFEIAKQA